MISARGTALLIQSLVNRQERYEGKRGIVKILIGLLLSTVLVICVILYILTSPIEFAGALGQFQADYSSLVAPEDNLTQGQPLTDEQYAAYVDGITDPDRKAVVESALSLVGKVPYFWGGKSGPGWNQEWNTPKLVTASGSSTSGTYQPYGLDCTGFVYWVYWTALGTDCLPPAAANSLWYGTDSISEDELQPGDIVYKDPPTVSVNHVGIYIGKDGNGKNLYVHCAFSAGGVTMNSYSGFRYFRRPPVLTHEEG